MSLIKGRLHNINMDEYPLLFNLVYNYDFQLFSNAEDSITTFDDYNHPDGYIFSSDSTSSGIGYDSSDYSCKIYSGSDATYTRISQKIHEVPRLLNQLKGKYITVKAVVESASGNLKMYIDDGVTSTGVFTSDTGSLELTHLISESATKIEIIFTTDGTSETNKLYSVYCNTGPSYIPGLNCIVQGRIGEVYSYNHTKVAPLGELERNGIELPEGYTRLESVLNSKFGTGGNGRSKLPDGRGYFDRQWDNGAGEDPAAASRTDRGDGTVGDEVGTLQADAMEEHYHLSGLGDTHNGDYNSSRYGYQVDPDNTTTKRMDGTGASSTQHDEGGKTSQPKNTSTEDNARTDDETRVKNIAALKTINFGRRG